jgi:small-conductance mechanosensitive channel
MVAAETKAIRDRLEGVKVELEQKEAALRRESLTDAELQTLRAEIDPALDLISEAIGSLAPRLEGARARLEQLGPKPKPGDPEESGDVRQDRAEREAQVAQLDETHRFGRALLVQAEQVAARINDRRRALFTAPCSNGTRAFSARASGRRWPPRCRRSFAPCPPWRPTPEAACGGRPTPAPSR